MVSAETIRARASSSEGKCQADKIRDQEAKKLSEAVDGLVQRNEEIIRSAAYFVAEVGEVEAAQQRACTSVSSGFQKAFSPEVLDILKGNADQLFQLKQEVVADKQAAKESSKKMLLWMSGSAAAGEQSCNSTAAASQPSVIDAIKQRGFRPLQLSGSSIAGVQAPATNSTWHALKFWQIGTHNSKQASGSRGAADTPGQADQQPQKSLSNMLFGKTKRHSSGGAADSASRRVSIDPAASWRSSIDGSLNGRRTSHRSSDAGAAMVAAAAAAGGSAAGSAERGGVMSSLAAGEGPLSKSHSMLATKPGTQQEQILGKSLEIVAEDEREGRDSPAPAEPLAGRRMGVSASQPLGLAPIRVPRGSITLGNRPGSPVDSFSFGNNRPEEEQPQSPSFLRSSVSSRMAHASGVGAVAGPLVRSSLALRAGMVSRVDPFEAPEPEPQPFVEQLRAEQQEAAAVSAQGGIMAALRRSISGGGRAAGRWEADAATTRRTPRQSTEGAAWAAAAAAGVSASQQLPRQQQGTYQQQQVSEGGASVQFLDLDATRAYALGVHQVMMRLEHNMASLHSQSEASSKPTTPRGSVMAEPGRTPAVPQPASEEAPQADAAPAAAAEVATRETEITEADPAETEELQQQLQQQLGDVVPQSPQQQPQSARSAPGSARTPRAESEAAGMPPLRSGMSSPAASRRQTMMGAPSSAARQLPLMGQASMEILERPTQLQSSRQQSLVGASTALSLADVYKQTSGNLAPLSSNLSGIGRRSSSTASKGLSVQPPSLSSRAAAGPVAASTSRSILGEAGPQAAAASGGMGPLSMQYGSTMQQAKKSAHAVGLSTGANQQEQRAAGGWGWQQGASTPPGTAALSDAAGGLDPAAMAGNNKYASSWGILDAGGLSRQSSMSGAQMSRVPSGAPLTRQGSGSARASPRHSTADDAQQQAAAWQQQQRLRGAAGRYAGASLTPGSQSPRSGAATPAREDSAAAAVGGAAAGALGSARRRAAGCVGSRQAEQGLLNGRGAQQQPRDGSTVGSEDYESAEEQLSSGASGLSGLSGPYGSAPGGPAQAAAGGGGGGGGLPNPPAFLSGRPTTAQAAVATQWSPSKHAAAFAQAPAYMRDAVMRISPEVSSTSYGLAPQGLQANSSRGVSPRESNTAAGPGRVSSSSIGGRVSQTSAYEGGYNIYAPLDPPAARPSSGRQQQPVVTAVDLARRQSQMRRASSTGAQQQGVDYGSASSNGRVSNSNSGQYTQSAFQNGGGYATVGTFPGGRQSQQQWEGNSQSGGIYGSLRPQQWQRQQYRF